MHTPPVGDAQMLKELLLKLYGKGAVRVDTENGFVLTKHRSNPGLPRSPTHIDLRMADQDDLWHIAACLAGYTRRNNLQFDGLCGIPNAGNPLARALQEYLYEVEARFIPLLTLEKGGSLLKAQELPRDSKVLLIDDVIEDGESKVELGVEPLQYERYAVTDCLVFCQRRPEGALTLAAHGVRLHYVLDALSLFDILAQARILAPDDWEVVRRYHCAPTAA
jgi:orotate phosphoribosyltransferase